MSRPINRMEDTRAVLEFRDVTNFMIYAAHPARGMTTRRSPATGLENLPERTILEGKMSERRPEFLARLS